MLEIKQLTYVRENKDLLRNITFSLKAGDLFWITGTNGSGKSTLLRLLVGILPWQAGTFHWRHRGAESLSPRATAYLRDLIYLGHQLGLKPKLSALENLRAWWDLRRDFRSDLRNDLKRDLKSDLRSDLRRDHLKAPKGVPQQDLRQALAELGLKKNQAQFQAVEQLSQGQKSRAALARLRIAPQSALWILDEPFAGLDHSGLTIVKDLCAQHLAAGGMIILTSQENSSHSIKADSIQHLHLNSFNLNVTSNIMNNVKNNVKHNVKNNDMNTMTNINSMSTNTNNTKNFNTESCNV